MLINKKLFKLSVTSSLTIASSLLLLSNTTIVHGATAPNDTTTEQQTPQQPTDDTTPPAGIQGNVIASGLDGTSHYYLTDQGTVYLMDGILDRDITMKLAASSSANTVTKIDTSLASKNSVKAPTDCSGLFSNIQNLKEFDLSNLNTSNVTDMSYMFASVQAKEGNLSNFDTAKVTNMSHMFYSSSFTSLDISSFDMKSVDPYADRGNGSNPFFPSTLKQITFGPKNVFVDYVMLPTKNANGTSTYDGWQNTGTGAALKLPNNHPISELYDGSDTKNGIETFVPYGVTEKHYDPIKFTLNIYLNGKKIVYQKNMIFLSLMEFHKYHQI
jgi:bacterial surface protein 26-residue repeat